MQSKVGVQLLLSPYPYFCTQTAMHTEKKCVQIK